ncbi:unnamed protein product [Mytilus coruscus]|uniref:Uncharacterized protein n=1 Tax=Mytilus coruscus TaxID=42192 RepID=A0A6J8DYW8_MYTCO|nr:unnamed protein product [Mytilus coruscus]
MILYRNIFMIRISVKASSRHVHFINFGLGGIYQCYLHEDDKIQLPLTIHHRVGFKSRYVDHSGHIFTRKPSSPTVTVQATTHVSDLALMKAAKTVAYMVRHTPSDVFMGVTRSHGVGIFTKQDTLTVFPENHHLADTAACHNKCDGSCKRTCTFDGRKYQEIAGVTNSRSVALDDNVLCNSHDPYRHKLNVVSHEFAHLIHRYMPSSYRSRISYAYNYAKQHHTWTTSYATATVNEYFAEGTTAFFMTTKNSKNAGGMDLCNHLSTICVNEMDARDHLKRQDPELYDILQNVYTNGHPSTPSGLKPCM